MGGITPVTFGCLTFGNDRTQTHQKKTPSRQASGLHVHVLGQGAPLGQTVDDVPLLVAVPRPDNR